MTDNKEREAFEAHYTKQTFTVQRDGDGYKHPTIQKAWEAWQARAALAASQEKAEPGDLFCYEFLDRAHCIQDSFHALISDHPAAHLCRDAIEKVGDALGDLYQAAGDAYHAGRETPRDHATFEVRVDGMPMASVSGPLKTAAAEAERYFLQYIDEGDVVELVEITVIQTHEVKHD